MRIAVVGQGSLGRALVRALRQKRISVRGFRGRAKLPSLDHDVVILAVRDEAIRRVAIRLRAASGAAVLHCAGAYSATELLEPVLSRVREVGKLHPLLSVSEHSHFRRVLFVVEGPMARRVARILGGNPVELRPRTSALYHAAAVLAAGHVTALLDAATEAAVRTGLSRAAARRALCTLARSAIANFERSGAAHGITGPIARGDAAVVARHLAALPSGLARVYRVLGLRALARSRAGSRDRQRLRALLRTR